MSIKTKILTNTASILIVVSAVILLFNIMQFSKYVDTVMTDSIDTALSVARDKIDYLQDQARSAAAFMAVDDELVNAVSFGNRALMLSRAGEMYKEAGLDFCTITNAQGVAIARPHNPDSSGDSVTAMPSVKSALQGVPLANIEAGTSVKLSICAASPIYNSGGTLVGVVVVGFRLDMDNYVDGVKEITGCETTVFLGEERIATTVRSEDGTRAVGTKASAGIFSTVSTGSDYSGTAKVVNRDAQVKYSPIEDSSGKVIGMLFVGKYLEEKSDTTWSFIQTGIIIVVASLAVTMTLTIVIVNRIVYPIRTMVEAARSLAIGDTNVSVSVKTKDEMHDLAEAFNGMIENTRHQTEIIKTVADGDLSVAVHARSEKDEMNRALSSMLDMNNYAFSQISLSADHVMLEARQIADGAQMLAQGSTEQASAVEQLSASIGEIADMTRNNATIARTAAELTGNIRSTAENGSVQMESMMKAVREINEASIQIEKVIKVIDDIAFRTNILALNAAVEAAHAGQHGKGFAVVAEEVRDLAAKSADAAKETGGLIENTVEKANFGLNIAVETSESLRDIVSGINRSAEIVTQIAQSSDEQAIAISQVNLGIEQVAQVVQQNSATAQEFAAASQEMNGQVGTLESMISQFRLREDEQPKMLSD